MNTLFLKKIYLFISERERDHWGRGRSRGREILKQTPCCAGGPMWGSIPGP